MAKLYFYYASMNAGKSTTLLQADFNYRERGMETMLFTAAVHDRSGFGVIDSDGSRHRYVASGCIKMAELPLPERLQRIYAGTNEIMKELIGRTL